MIKERAQGVLSVLRTNAAKVKDLDPADLKGAFNDVDWKAFRDVQVRGAKDAVEGIKRMRRDDAAERRNGVMLAAVGAAIGAALMYFLDPGNGRSRRSSAGERVKRWYLRGRGQLDHSWRELQSESRSFDLTEKARTDGEPLDAPGQASRQEASTLPH